MNKPLGLSTGILSSILESASKKQETPRLFLLHHILLQLQTTLLALHHTFPSLHVHFITSPVFGQAKAARVEGLRREASFRHEMGDFVSVAVGDVLIWQS